MARLTEEDVKLLKERQFAAIATVNRDGSVQQTPVWIDTDGEAVIFNTAKGRLKDVNLGRDPRVSILVIDRDDPYRWLSVRGRAELVTEGADEHIDALANKYLGVEKFSDRPEGQVRVIVRVVPEHRVAGY